jgi:hypothetical protein
MSSQVSAITTGSSVVRSAGNLAWTNTSNITADDGSYATLTGLTVPGVSYTSRYLQGVQLVTGVPSGAVINGIALRINRKADTDSGGAYVVDREVYVVKGGTIQTTENKADTSTHWPTSDGDKTYGSSTSLWGLSWTASDINGAGFGFALCCDANGDGATTTAFPYVDYFEATIYYTLGGRRRCVTMML